ncbi:MAG: ester cyclase [Sphaerobacter sp.]|nr:ester cyclase [Sphaerobacter sp.]
MTAAERNAAVVRRAVQEIWNDGNVEVADALFTLEYVNHHGLITDLVRGPEAIKVSVILHRTAFPSLHVTVEGLVADATVVAFRWTARSAPAAESPGRAARSPKRAWTA